MLQVMLVNWIKQCKPQNVHLDRNMREDIMSGFLCVWRDLRLGAILRSQNNPYTVFLSRSYDSRYEGLKRFHYEAFHYQPMCRTNGHNLCWEHRNQGCRSFKCICSKFDDLDIRFYYRYPEGA